jgi:2-dehydro-3-deoxygluconokinase
MKTYAAFGEIMLRLSPPGHERLFQSPRLEARFGGAEANVAVSLARFGHPVRFVSFVPPHPIGDAAVSSLAAQGVETSFVGRRGERLGVYYAETGSNQRPSRVVYDRQGSSLAEASPGDVDWGQALSGVDGLHLTGITPALSASAAGLALEAARTARSLDLSVSLDLNFRSKLWAYGKPAPEVMTELVKFADLVLANEEDIQKALGLGVEAAPEPGTGPLDLKDYERLAARVMSRFSNVTRVAITMRESLSADHNRWSAALGTGDGFLVSRRYDIPDVVDRIGTGDAFAAGLLHGLEAFDSDQAALEFAAAASCLKHSIPGDFNLVGEKEVLDLIGGDASGRIQR